MLAVGPNSEWGKTMALVQTEAVDTPLQGNLTQLAGAIGKIGLVAGVLCFVALMIRWRPGSHHLQGGSTCVFMLRHTHFTGLECSD